MSILNMIKSIQDIMRQDPGVDGDAQRISQLVWMLFLKVYDAKEEEQWELLDDTYVSIIPEELKWRNWAVDRLDGTAKTGEELLNFINEVLFPGLKNLEVDQYTDKRAAIVKYAFEDAYNYMKNGTLIRQVINVINQVDFASFEDRHTFNDVYETILKDLQSAGNAGEFYTPRAVTDFIVKMLDPRIGESFGDYACGTGGFIISALKHMEKQPEFETLEGKEKAFRGLVGTEKKQLPHLLAMTNLILHDVDIPNIKHGNSLEVNVREIPESEKVNKIGMNPPFGGIEEKIIQMNFPQSFRTSETADLFMVLIMERLKNNGKCGVVLPDGFLFGAEGAKRNIKEKLLNDFNLHTIIRLPNGVFAPYTGITTNLLFFDKIGSTKEVWFYEHQLPEGYKNYAKTKPIRLEEFDAERQWWSNRVENDFAWKVSIEDIKNNNYNLDYKNPNREFEEELKSTGEIISALDKSMRKSIEILEVIKGMMK